MHRPKILRVPRKEASAAIGQRFLHIRGHLPRDPHLPHVRHRPFRRRATAGTTTNNPPATTPNPILSPCYYRTLALHVSRSRRHGGWH